jgi:hypothetical protein
MRDTSLIDSHERAAVIARLVAIGEALDQLRKGNVRKAKR